MKHKHPREDHHDHYPLGINPRIHKEYYLKLNLEFFDSIARINKLLWRHARYVLLASLVSIVLHNK